MKLLLLAISSKYIHSTLGMHSIYNYCKRKELDVELCEETIQTPYLKLVAEIATYKPDIVGINVHIWNKNYVFGLTDVIKKAFKDVKIILGGPEVSFTPKESFEECKDIDYILSGEGETAIYDFVRDLENKKECTIKSISERKINGTIRYASQMASVKDLSVLGFPYENLDRIVAQHKIVYYESTRGCPFNCSYCLSGNSQAVRKIPLDMVLKDLQFFIDAKVPLLKFVDRTYNLDEKHYLPIMKFLAAAATDATFHFEIKADLITDDILEFLSTVPKNRFQFEIGIQSTNKKTLEAINRADNWSRLVKVVEALNSFENIDIHLDLIIGLPYETYDIFKKSFNDVYHLNANMLQIGFLKILKGSSIWNSGEYHSYKYMSEAPYEVISTKYISYSEIRFLKIMEDLFDYTYNSEHFKNTLNYIVNNIYKGNAFNFYENITKWWDNNKYYLVGQNSKRMTLLFLEYFKECEPNEYENVRKILKYDVFINIPNYKPEELIWNNDQNKELILEFWRNLEIVHKYLPEYNFSTWRKLRKYFPIEVVEWSPREEIFEKTIILANYSGQGAKYKIIDKDDFYDTNLL